MQVRLLRRPPADKQAGERAASEYALQVQRLTIGRASFQDLQLPDPHVELQHAVIRPHKGALRIEARTRSGIKVNGAHRSAATLFEGDVVLIGAASITVRRARKDASVLLEIEEPPASSDRELAALHTLSLRETGLSARFWSWALLLSVVALFLIPPLSASVYSPARPLLRSASLTPSDTLWQPGALHPSHQFIGGNCNACHTTLFHRVANAQCTACHGRVQHHVNVQSTDIALFEEERCGECHVEHQEPSTLVRRNPRLCSGCHGHLRELKKDTTLADVADFGTDHPDFRLAVLGRTSTTSSVWQLTRVPRGVQPAEHSGLIFSHADHMKAKGIKSPRGYEVLKCEDCHRPDSSGRLMQPIRMQTQCARCHSLLFDEHNPATSVPHGNLKAVFETLQSHFIRSYLDASRPPQRRTSEPRRPGGEAEIMSRDEQRRARDWADTQSLLIAGELLEKRVCVQCHHIARVPGATGLDRWQVEPVRITQDWLPLARFSHASHATTPCKTCHAKAATSKASSEVLMPTIGTCRQCHSGAHDSTKLASDCGMCHAFHLPGRGPFDAAARQTALTRR